MRPEAKLIARLTAVFGEPRSDNPELFVEEFARAIAGYGDDVLATAGDEIIRTSTFWPKPGEVRAIADRINSSRRVPEYSRAGDYDRPPPTPEQAARALALVEEMKRNMAASGRLTVSEKKKPWHDTSRPAFEKMQRESPNRELHEMPRTLTARSRAMTGESE